MSVYEKIIEQFPIVSYEEDRERDGRLEKIYDKKVKNLADGVVYKKSLYRKGNGQDVWCYITEVSPKANVSFAVSAGPLKKIAPVLSRAEEFDGNVLFAMNAGFFHFFNNGDRTPYGIQIVRGVVLAEPGRERLDMSTFFFGVTKNGQAIIADSDAYFDGLKNDLEYAVGGGLMLIKDGRITLHQGGDQHPRTAVGIAKDGTVILMCCDGRSEISAGFTYGDIIDCYINLGYEIENLLNLDGGGSTTVVLRGENGLFIDNIPCNAPNPEFVGTDKEFVSCARPVSDTVLIVEKD